MALPKTLTNFTAFIDGFGWAGKVTEATLPSLAIVTEELHAGGMAAPTDIDMGSVEKMEFELTFAEYSALLYRYIGQRDVPVTLRGAQRAPDGTTESVVYSTRSLVRADDPGAWQRGQRGAQKLMLTADYLKVTVNEIVVAEIDIETMVRNINGQDQLAATRRALGI